MKHTIIIISVLLMSSTTALAQGRINSKDFLDSGIRFFVNTVSGNTALMKDSCSWVQKVDSIKLEYAITVDSNGFLRKQKADILIRKYEHEECKWRIGSNYSVKNEVFILNGVPVEIIMYMRKRGNIGYPTTN